MEIQLRKPRHAGDWLRLYGLYLAAFPPEERKPFAIIRRMYRRGSADVWCIWHRGQFLGLATTVNSPGPVLLDYFAVRKAYRGRGIGSRAMEQILARYGTRGCFLEIESTREGTQDRARKLRRRAFYQAAGFQDLHTRAGVFGVEMELLGVGCRLDFQAYHSFYRDHYSPWAAEHIKPAE